MSKYTTELRYICESQAGLLQSQGFNRIEEIISASRPHIFDFQYPIFDDTYKPVLETKFLRHYYTREICEETYGLWKLRICDELNMIMDYYNQLYKSALLEFNPFNDVDYQKTNIHTDTSSASESGDTHNNSHSTYTHGEVIDSSGLNLMSDTPQGTVRGLEDIEDKMYLTQAVKNTERDTHSGTDINDTNTWIQNLLTRNGNNSGNYTDTIKGKIGTTSYSKLLKEFRQTFLNIDMDVINSLSDCFINLW